MLGPFRRLARVAPRRRWFGGKGAEIAVGARGRRGARSGALHVVTIEVRYAGNARRNDTCCRCARPRRRWRRRSTSSPAARSSTSCGERREVPTRAGPPPRRTVRRPGVRRSRRCRSGPACAGSRRSRATPRWCSATRSSSSSSASSTRGATRSWRSGALLARRGFRADAGAARRALAGGRGGGDRWRRAPLRPGGTDGWKYVVDAFPAGPVPPPALLAGDPRAWRARRRAARRARGAGRCRRSPRSRSGARTCAAGRRAARASWSGRSRWPPAAVPELAANERRACAPGSSGSRRWRPPACAAPARRPAPRAGAARGRAVADLRLRGRAGPPVRRAPARSTAPLQGRRRDAPLLRLRRRGRRKQGAARCATVAGPARDAFLEGYRSRAARRLLPEDDATAEVLLASLELEKLLYELRYEVGHRPDWVESRRGDLLRGGTVKRPVDAAEVDAQIQRLVELRHPDPHAVLGVHPDGDGVVVRAYRPDAERVTVLPDFGGQIPARHRKPGLFEARLNGRTRSSATCSRRLPRRRQLHPARPVQLPAYASVSWTRTSPPRDATSGSGSGSARIRGTTTASAGPSFAVWAPTARRRLGGGRLQLLGRAAAPDAQHRARPASGSCSSPRSATGARYKFEIRPGHGGAALLKADPYAFRTESPPATASVVHELDRYSAGTTRSGWSARREQDPDPARRWRCTRCTSARWRRVVGGRQPALLPGRRRAAQLADYVSEMGFTHVELLPVAEHPFGGSWGYQVDGLLRAHRAARAPRRLPALVDELHQRGIGVILDWVPAHFPTRRARAGASSTARALYEHEDPRLGRASRLGHAGLQLRPQRGAQLPARQRALLAGPVPRRRAAGGRGRRMLYRDYSRRAGRVDPEPATAAARTRRPSPSSARSTSGCAICTRAR